MQRVLGMDVIDESCVLTLFLKHNRHMVLIALIWMVGSLEQTAKLTPQRFPSLTMTTAKGQKTG